MDEPPEGSIVKTALKEYWYRSNDSEGGGWFLCDKDGCNSHGDPESWGKVNGNYGPATLIRLGW
jgi:hypothetical protein